MNTSQKLGIRVFNYYLSKRMYLGIAFLVISFLVSTMKDVIASKIVSVFSIETTASIVNYFTLGLFLVSALVIILALIISWLQYINCSFTLGENAISIKRGFLNKKEVSIPYRQIQNINIEQSLKHRMMGVSKLVILTAGNDGDNTVGKAEGVFEVIDSKLALTIKEYILQKTSIQPTKEIPIQ